MAGRKNSRRLGKKKDFPQEVPAAGQNSANYFRPRRLAREVAALMLLGLAAFVFLALVSYSPRDPSTFGRLWAASQVANWGGKVGAWLAGWGFSLFGVAAFLIPLALLGLAWLSHRSGLEQLGWYQVLSGSVALLAGAGLLSFARPYLAWEDGLIHSGGRMGDLLCQALIRLLNRPGAALVMGLMFMVGFMGATRLSLAGLGIFLKEKIRGYLLSFRPGKIPAAEAVPAEEGGPGQRQPLIATPERSPGEGAAAGLRMEPPLAEEPLPRARRAGAAKGRFNLPPLELLDPPQPWDHQLHESQMMAQAGKLEDTLRHFGVEGKVTAIIAGPVVSRFELEPAPGVKISKVTSLADDLALALKALSIRIVAPVPGKAVIGIEIPNPKRQVVALQEILADASYQKSPSRLTIALGKDIMGTPVVTDLAKMPHLLIAGATGSGKSVGLNAMILSILFKATPEEVRFLMIDPKRIELSTYEGIPHLLHPVVVNPKEATTALHWTVAEMERRYALLSELGVRNIEGYNQKAKGLKEMPEGDGGALPRFLPYIVVVIDELADLMLVSSRDTEEYLIRLAQKARASGIHLLVATQRPSVDVITGLIKANFPTRISYQVSSKADSRVILDTIGAERLLGKGDLLFLPPGTSRLKRVHGAYVSEDEVLRVVNFLKAQAEPVYEPGLLEMQKQEKEEEPTGERDEKWEEAVALVAETRSASISMLQRRLRIGYNRAARIIEAMEKEGLVGPSDGLKPREVYIPRR